MKAQDYVRQFGGKAGGIYYLRDLGGFDKHLLPCYYIPFDRAADNIEDLLPSDIQENWILRGTHPNDYNGLVDILESYPLIGFDKPQGVVLDMFWSSIGLIREEANNPEIFKYSNYEGQPYDGKVGIAVQPLNVGMESVRGSVVEHPHERGTYLIDIVTNPQARTDPLIMERIVISRGTLDEEHTNLRYLVIRDWHREIAEEIVELYQKVRRTDFIPEDTSFQMEWGLNRKGKWNHLARVLFYQARPFLKFQEPSFEMPNARFKYMGFGMTSEEGLVLPVISTEMGRGLNDVPYRFAWVDKNMTPRLGPEVRPKNMAAFVPAGLRVEHLEHNTYRWVKKAEVSVLNGALEPWLQGFRTGEIIKIISNGVSHKLEKVAA